MLGFGVFSGLDWIDEIGGRLNTCMACGWDMWVAARGRGGKWCA